MKFSRCGICLRSDGTAARSRLRCVLSNWMWMTWRIGPAPLLSAQALLPLGAVHATVTDWTAGQPAAASPSEAVSVSVAVPGAVHVKRGSGVVAPVRMPLDADQLYVSADGPASLSCADELRPIDRPTSASAGLAPSASICGQMLMVPLMSTLPNRGAS